MLSEHDKKPAVLLFARDITSIKKESTEVVQLSAAVRSLHSAVTITDMQRNIIYINPAHKDIFGYNLDELIGKQSSMLYPSKKLLFPFGRLCRSKQSYQNGLVTRFVGKSKTISDISDSLLSSMPETDMIGYQQLSNLISSRL